MLPFIAILILTALLLLVIVCFYLSCILTVQDFSLQLITMLSHLPIQLISNLILLFLSLVNQSGTIILHLFFLSYGLQDSIIKITLQSKLTTVFQYLPSPPSNFYLDSKLCLLIVYAQHCTVLLILLNSSFSLLSCQLQCLVALYLCQIPASHSCKPDRSVLSHANSLTATFLIGIYQT